MNDLITENHVGNDGSTDHNVLYLLRAEARRQDDLRSAADLRYTAVADLRETHAASLRHNEAERIDALRRVDVAAVQKAVDVADERAAALATAVARTSETLRGQVDSTAGAAATALASSLAPIQEAIADLRRVQYEQQGQKSQVVEGRAKGSGVHQWLALGVATAAVLSAGCIGTAGIVVTLLLRG